MKLKAVNLTSNPSSDFFASTKLFSAKGFYQPARLWDDSDLMTLGSNSAKMVTIRGHRYFVLISLARWQLPFQPSLLVPLGKMYLYIFRRTPFEFICCAKYSIPAKLPLSLSQANAMNNLRLLFLARCCSQLTKTGNK